MKRREMKYLGVFLLCERNYAGQISTALNFTITCDVTTVAILIRIDMQVELRIVKLKRRRLQAMSERDQNVVVVEEAWGEEEAAGRGTSVIGANACSRFF